MEQSIVKRLEDVERDNYELLKRIGLTLADIVSERRSARSNVSSVKQQDVPVRNGEQVSESFSVQERVQGYVNAIPDNTSNQDVFQTFAQQAYLNRLPVPEPSVFMGDPLMYAEWKHSFQVLIEGKGIPPLDKIHYLKMYVGGAAKECLEGFFLYSSPNGYDEARKVLEERFGNDVIVSNAFRDKLEQWPKISNRDNVGLRKYADFLRQCNAAMRSIEGLDILNDRRENQKMLRALPTQVVGIWGRKVHTFSSPEHRYPPFSDFVDFIVNEAEIANDPITSLSCVKGGKVSMDTKKSDYKVGARAYVSNTQHDEKREPKCLFCEKSHYTDLCRDLGGKTLAEKNDFVKKSRVCFKCLKKGHIAKECKVKVKCKKCEGKHATAMCRGGKESRDNENQESQEKLPEAQVLSSHSKNGVTSKSSMIVPVYVSHKRAPKNKVLVYALLDTQSDSSFILNDTAESLRVSGPKVDMQLSTMLAENAIVQSEKIEGLQVRGYRGGNTISLPSVYTRDIMPADKSHIPTAEMAMKWPYLSGIANKLEPIKDCQVGLLIGYDCAKALAPLEVIPPQGDGPYGQRTELGWGIVGVIEKGKEEKDHGVSHRMLTQVVPNE